MHDIVGFYDDMDINTDEGYIWYMKYEEGFSDAQSGGEIVFLQ